MFKNLNNIFNTSKIDKKNVKTKNIQHYIESLKKTQTNEITKIEKMNENSKDFNQNIVLDPFLSNYSHDSDVKIIDESILKKINILNMVYKECYQNKFVSGFGDFLRGSFFLLEFCKKYQITPNFIILHPIKYFLKNKTKLIPTQIAEPIEFCEYINQSFEMNSTYNEDTSLLYYEMFDYLNRQPTYQKNMFVYTICYPTIKISEENKKIIRNIIEPTDEIKATIENILQILNLFKRQFQILHIRSGDQYLNKTKDGLDERYKIKLIAYLMNHFQKNQYYLLIADNVFVKNLLIQEFPFLKCYFKDITHLGEHSQVNRENVKNTLIDFYIMSYSHTIYSISCYDHGSGFSKWCAFTYNIPYFCVKI